MLPGVIQIAELSDTEFLSISKLVKNVCGISLSDDKKELVKARLAKRLRKLQLGSFKEYMEYLRQDSDGVELTAMLDAISTNKTSFFREDSHFKYLTSKVLPDICHKNRRLRLWSAACSSGEEPYSIAMTLHEAISNIDKWDARILATDISTKVLKLAGDGKYAGRLLDTVSVPMRTKYFTRLGSRQEPAYQVCPNIRKLVHFSRLNLMGHWPMQGPFDVIFCRNVMIYFDKPTQAKLIGRFWDLLAPGGTLFVGHCESLAGIQHRFKNVNPAVYQKA